MTSFLYEFNGKSISIVVSELKGGGWDWEFVVIGTDIYGRMDGRPCISEESAIKEAMKTAEFHVGTR